jgi:peptidyl-tRNA hydrolase
MSVDRDFFCIHDVCLTELKLDEIGSCLTCIGFAPMEAEKIDIITKKLKLYRS